MAELNLEIRTMLDLGNNPVQIAETLDVSLEMIDDVLESVYDELYSPFATSNS